MRRLRHRFVLALSCVALATAAFGTTGCGAGGHYLGGIVAHHALNHFAHTAKAQRRVNKVFCLYHGHRVVVDLLHHHVITGGLNAIAAYHACKGGFGRR